MVVFFFRCVPAQTVVPLVQGELPQCVLAPGGNLDLRLLQCPAHPMNARHHIVIRLQYRIAAVAQHRLCKAGGGGVNDQRRNGSISRQFAQVGIVFLISKLHPGGSTGVVILCHPAPDISVSAPQPQGKGIDRAVVAREIPGPGRRCRRPHMPLGVKHGVHQSVCRHPAPLYEPAVKGAAVQSLVPPQHRRRQRGIVRHLKVQVQHLLFRRFLDPLFIEPMIGVLRIAVKPIGGPLQRAPGQCLLHKGAGH